MLNRIFKACMVAMGLCLGTGQVSAQTFSPDGKQILFPHYTPQGSPVQAIVNTDGTGLMEIPESSGSVVAKWSPNGKYILFGNAQRKVKLYQIRLGKTRTIAHNVEPPFAWREDSVTFAAVRVSRDQTTQRETRELCRFDRDGYPLGQTHLGDIRLAPFAPLYWIPNTDEQIFMTNEQTNVNAYLTDSHELRKVSSSNDLIGMGSIGNSQHVVWARRGRNFRYILMTLYRFNATLTSVSRPEFPERIPALNPDPHHAPDSIFNVRFSPDGSRLIVVARVTEAQKSLFQA
ncbi:MAG: hypothetical protein NT023_17020, partial [Armatimonadetes bacterium]|nr:hypothetical protein [Armatimonadota bacterium]